jgi:DNA polymerase-3 subunit gamma/tau
VPRRPPVATGEPDIPLPPEPDDDEGWPQPVHAAGAPQRPAPGTPPAAPVPRAPEAAPQPSVPRAAAEHSPAPRGGEPTPLVSAAPEPAADDGALTTADVRRIWPELLAVVKRHKRTTEALLKSAQVHDLTNGTLTLAATSPALAKMLGDDLNKDIVRQALQELLGVRWKVQAVVDTPGRPAPGTPAPTPEAARAATQAAETAEADELLAERAADVASGEDGPVEPVLDAEQAALQLLRTELGARPIDS